MHLVRRGAGHGSATDHESFSIGGLCFRLCSAQEVEELLLFASLSGEQGLAAYGQSDMFNLAQNA